MLMKIGVLSDTHICRAGQAQQLAERLLRGPFAEVDAIFHAGDAVIADLESCFYPLPWYAVRGNMDQQLVDLPVSRVVSLAGKKIGLVHGWGGVHGIEQRVKAHFYGFDLAAVVFGHSHQPVCRREGSLLLFNPGSATDRRNAPAHTVGILTLEENKEIYAEIIPLD
jgi:putative phosphoesterase